jgi:hypothetical protein
MSTASSICSGATSLEVTQELFRLRALCDAEQSFTTRKFCKSTMLRLSSTRNIPHINSMLLLEQLSNGLVAGEPLPMIPFKKSSELIVCSRG